MKKIVLILLALIFIVINAQADLKKDIKCSAIYSGLTVGLNKQGKYALSQKIQIAEKARIQRIISKLGKEKGRDQVLSKMKTIRQIHTGKQFNMLTKECIKEDGI